MTKSLFRSKRAGRPNLKLTEITAIVAIVLSVSSLCFSYWTFTEQKRQWRQMSLGNVEMTKAAYIFWRTLTLAEAKQMNWGYFVNVMPLLDGHKVSDLVGVPTRLILIDPTNNRRISDIAALTMAELEQQAKVSQGLPQAVVPAKQYQLQVDFENVGATRITDLRIAIDSKMPDTGKWNDGPWSQPIELASHKTVFKISELTSPVNAPIPDRIG